MPPLPGASSGSIYESATNIVFHLIHHLTAREPRQYPYPSPADDLRGVIQEQLPFQISASTNDGVVPTLSQVWGRIGGVYLGDHLDVIGQYTHVNEDGRFEGWLHDKAGFDDARFDKVWNDIADAIAFPQAQPVLDLRAKEPSAATKRKPLSKRRAAAKAAAR